MRRRDFITLLGGAATWPLVARAQPTIPVIGYLGGESARSWGNRVEAFRQGLSEAGYVQGRNVEIEYRWAEGQGARLPALAAELVRRQVTVIVAGDTGSTAAATAATKTIPIVFRTGSDPVAFGLARSLNRPGSNTTGATTLNQETLPKRLELLHELIPTATLAVLVKPTDRGDSYITTDLQAAARMLGVRLDVLYASTEREVETAFTRLLELRAGGLVIDSSPYFEERSDLLAALALHHAVPTISAYRESVVAGGLMSYGADLIPTP
jgi:putative ABC transport system substrate-binding protein